MNNVDSGCFLRRDVQISSAGVLVTPIDAHTRCHYDFHVQFCVPFGAWVAQLVSDWATGLAVRIWNLGRMQKNCHCYRTSKPAVGLIQPPVQWIQRFLSGCKVGQTSQSSAEAKNAGSCTSTLLICLHCMDKDTFIIISIQNYCMCQYAYEWLNVLVGVWIIVSVCLWMIECVSRLRDCMCQYAYEWLNVLVGVWIIVSVGLWMIECVNRHRDCCVSMHMNYVMSVCIWIIVRVSMLMKISYAVK